MARTLDSITDLDLRDYLRPGDGVLWGQACAEPRTLIGQLLRQRHELSDVTIFLGIAVGDTIRPEHADTLGFTSYTAAGGNAALHAAGALDVLPAHYSSFPELIDRGQIRSDVVLVQLSPPDAEGRYSLGLTRDYLVAALGRARVVLGEVNPWVPWTYGGPTVTAEDLAVIVTGVDVPAQHTAGLPTPVQQHLAEQVAALIPDEATLQIGVGSLTECVLHRLADRRRLGVHSGLITDAVADLMQAGVITGERKSLDTGLTVTGTLLGTQRLFDFAHRNPSVAMRDTNYTHDPQVLAAQDRLVAVNSALQVDLSGQINAEVARGRYVGAVGGAADFLRGAARSRGGLPIVMLPARAGTASRIVTRLNGPVSTARSDAGIVVTEYGAADLRGLTLQQRYERMLDIAAPELRADLEHAAEAMLSGPHQRTGVLR